MSAADEHVETSGCSALAASWPTTVLVVLPPREKDAGRGVSRGAHRPAQETPRSYEAVRTMS